MTKVERLTEELKQSVLSLKGTKVSEEKLFELSLKRDFIKFLINKEREQVWKKG